MYHGTYTSMFKLHVYSKKKKKTNHKQQEIRCQWMILNIGKQ